MYFPYLFLIAIPSPIMNIMTTGIIRAGEEYNIACSIEVIDRLIVTPTIVWIKDSVNTSLVSDDLKRISVPSVLSNISDTMYSLSLFFSSLNTFDAGQYTCQATITVNEINATVTNTSVLDLPLQSRCMLVFNLLNTNNTSIDITLQEPTKNIIILLAILELKVLILLFFLFFLSSYSLS